MKATLIKYKDYFIATVETKNSKRYIATYSHFVTENEILEDFKENKTSFKHIN